ncbi:hypothetical protein HBA55_29785 [Pseudomaricurvus alkylphenolicus]|uniref:hypothetical protein n=1 Tax=Pseudomaricurvus alkylphenolicus TaxID=1306991 RepID=UPI0014229606|nr:hypothetical protein [Pseudomaricurvus alkylphenolicus]NIB43831.1 hypothetical protein [Pseudomaricurvus alkylphenolicus]
MTKVEWNLDTMVALVNGIHVSDEEICPDHIIFDNISPYQVWVLAREMGYRMGFREGAANDE